MFTIMKEEGPNHLINFVPKYETNTRNMYNIFDPKGLTFLTRLRLGLSQLNQHRFRHTV